MKKCENCGKEHAGNYGSGRFCSNKCARGFSTKEKRNEINEKVSIKLTKQQDIQRKIADKHASYQRETEVTSLFDLSKRTAIKILKRMKLPCSNCGWYVDDVIGDVHHIKEKNKGGDDKHQNLTYICPNCHRLVHSGKINPNDLINLDDYIGDTWKEYYYVKNGKLINK